MKTYFISGGAGFIGSNFIHYILNKYNNDIFVINFDKLTYAGNLNNLCEIEKKPNYKFIRGDICDEEYVEYTFKQYKIDYVINFAAESHVDRSIEEPGIFVRTNVFGTQVLLNVAKNNWSREEASLKNKRYIQISTDEVYGSLGPNGYFTEKTPLDPHSPYSASKAGADLLVKSYYDTYGLPVNITRCSNNYGPYQFPEKLIPLTINNCLNGMEVPVYGDGRNIRDWLYVEDHCRAIDMVVNKGRPGKVYNIGGNNEKLNIEIVKIIISELSRNLPQNDIRKNSLKESLIKYVDDRKGHDRRYAVDAAKIKREIGWEPEISFEKGIVKTIKWYLDNELWLKNVTSGEYEAYYERMYK